MNKAKKISLMLIIVLFCIGLIAFFVLSIPTLTTRTWTLAYAQKIDAPYNVVAHNKNDNFSDIQLFQFSKPVEVVLEAKNGTLVLTDKTNKKTYEGTYKTLGLISLNYKVFIDGLEGTANISSVNEQLLSVFIGGYNLCFEVD